METPSSSVSNSADAPILSREQWRAVYRVLHNGAFFDNREELGQAHDAIGVWLGE